VEGEKGSVKKVNRPIKHCCITLTKTDRLKRKYNRVIMTNDEEDEHFGHKKRRKAKEGRSASGHTDVNTRTSSIKQALSLGDN